MPTKGGDWQKKRRLGDDSFDRMLAEVNAVAKDRDEVSRLMTEKVLLGLVQRQSMKLHQWMSSTCQIPKRKRSSLYQKGPMKKVTNPEPAPENKEKKKENSLKEKKQVMRRSASTIPSQVPEMPEALTEKIGSLHGYQLQFVMHKTLFRADLRKDQSRMTMPKNQVLNKEFLGEFYKEKLKSEKQMRVKVIDPSLNVHELRLTKWNFTNSFSYALTSGWYDNIVADKTNNLMEKDVLQVWSFQVDKPDSLCLALVKVPKDDDEGPNEELPD